MENLKEMIKGIRSIRGENNIPPAKELKVYLILKEGGNAHLKELLQKQSAYIVRLSKLSEFKIVTIDDSKPAYCATFIGNMVTLYVDLTGITDPKDEIKRLEKQIEKVNSDLALIAKKFENPNFAKNAPEKLVREEVSRKKELETKRNFLSGEIEKLKKRI
jgi:valyl-tRNA synthetase